MNRERGSALIMALLVVVVVGMVTSLAAARNRLLAHERIMDIAERKAFHAADGGVEWALVALKRDPMTRGLSLSIGECEVVVEIKHLEAGTAEIRSRAVLYPRGDKALPHSHQVIVTHEQ